MNQEPSILETERALLATLMLRPGDCFGVDITAEQFASDQHATIFERIKALTEDSQPVDPVSVMESFQSGKRELGTLALKISGENTTTTQPASFAQRIKAAWRLRKARAIAAELHGARDEAAIDAALEALMGLHATEARHEWSAKDAVRETIKALQRAHNGEVTTIPTGLRDLDEKLGGLHDGDLIVIGARPSMGKTALLLNLARNAARMGHPVGLISGEQPMEQATARILSLASGVPATQFRRGIRSEEMWGRVADAMSETSALPLWMLDRSSPTLAEVVRVARRWKHTHGIRALYVDYLQRIETEGDRRHEQVGAAAKGLKNLARDLNIPVVVLAQVSRQVEMRKPPEPRMGDLSDSSEIEKEADQVLLLYRASYYDDKASEGVAKLLLDKNRHGGTGYVECAWRQETMQFADLAWEHTT